VRPPGANRFGGSDLGPCCKPPPCSAPSHRLLPTRPASNNWKGGLPALLRAGAKPRRSLGFENSSRRSGPRFGEVLCERCWSGTIASKVFSRAFVCGVCRNVMKELLRWEIRHAGSASEFEPADDRVDLEALLVNQQRRQQVDRILEELPEKDRELLRMFFLEECDKSEICKRLKVREDYLRVLLHRAKFRFRSMHSKRSAHV
jgi:hypothetical protein